MILVDADTAAARRQRWVAGGPSGAEVESKGGRTASNAWCDASERKADVGSSISDFIPKIKQW
jgi:hypothetical protein